MHQIYLASHPAIAKLLVLKIFSPAHLARRPLFLRFLQEARIIANSNHPNLIQLYGHGEWQQRPYLAMEFIQGISLCQFAEQPSFSCLKITDLLLQISYALHHLHSHGIIHRDLKPEHILLTESGIVKVLDFSTALLYGTDSKPFEGTPFYMSPEQKTNGQIAFSSDIYSLGLIARDLLMEKDSILNPIIKRMLVIHPQSRYQDIIECITDLRSARTNLH